MTDNHDNKYAFYRKVAWGIYALITIIIAAGLVLFVARDNEEMFFYGLLIPAGFYVFRPTGRYIDRLILKYTGVSKPDETE
jgi:lipopolysaccharide export LptBFGC system permease protein LptF